MHPNPSPSPLAFPLTPRPPAFLLQVHRAHQLPVGDFPDVTKFRNTMLGHELTKFPKLDKHQVEALESVLSVDIPRLLAMFPQVGTYPYPHP